MPNIVTQAAISGAAFSHFLFIPFLILILAIEVTDAHKLLSMITAELASGLEEVDIIIIGGTFEQDTISTDDKMLTPCPHRWYGWLDHCIETHRC